MRLQSDSNQKCLQNAVKTVIEEEDRAKNVIIFGLAEVENEVLEDKVGAVIEELGEKLKLECSRIGKKKPGNTRPVKVNKSLRVEQQHFRSSGKVPN